MQSIVENRVAMSIAVFAVIIAVGGLFMMSAIKMAINKDFSELMIMVVIMSGIGLGGAFVLFLQMTKGIRGSTFDSS